uniref:Uncharacterized protein n=1 Tax=Oncorhynchus tshawytscha TaxID=74940 RepID=A0A8C8H4B0_ONCTS
NKMNLHEKTAHIKSGLTKSKNVQTWKELFLEFYTDLGHYIDHYGTLNKAWDDLKRYLDPRMIASLKEGAKEELDGIEVQVGCKISNDDRCSYRIHNGQKLVVPGYDNVFVLMGSMALSNHYRSEDLLDNETAAGGFKQRKGMRPCLPLTFCFHTGLSQYMALWRAPFHMRPHFTEWFTSYVHNVVTGEDPIIWDQTSRYVHDKQCVSATGYYCFSVPLFPLLISNACRYWKITNANVEEKFTYTKLTVFGTHPLHYLLDIMGRSNQPRTQNFFSKRLKGPRSSVQTLVILTCINSGL